MARTYLFDIDTKRYLNRVNTYRFANGLPDITKSDAVDIDNFVVGLKDLGAWPYLVEAWLCPVFQNIGTGSTVLSFFNNNNNATLVNSPQQNTEGVLVTANNQYIGLNSTPITFGEQFCIIPVYRFHTNTTITSDEFTFYGFPNNETISGRFRIFNSSGSGRDPNINGYGGVMVGTNTGNYSTYKNRNEFQIIGLSFERLTTNGGGLQSEVNNAMYNSNTSTGTTNSYSRTTDLYTTSSPARIFYNHVNATVNSRTLNSLFVFRAGLKFQTMFNIRNVLINSILKKQTVI